MDAIADDYVNNDKIILYLHVHSPTCQPHNLSRIQSIQCTYDNKKYFEDCLDNLPLHKSSKIDKYVAETRLGTLMRYL